MSKNDKSERGGWGALAEAARALEGELSRFEELATSARKMPLNTHKAIDRAAKATTHTANEQERVDLALGALVRAITAVRERHEANVAALQERGEEIRRRAEQLGALYERFAVFGEESKLINQLVQETTARQREATTPEGMREVTAAIGAIEERMTKLADEARTLAQAASAASITELSTEADTLRQQMVAARNKLGLLRKSLDVGPPDPSRLN